MFQDLFKLSSRLWFCKRAFSKPISARHVQQGQRGLGYWVCSLFRLSKVNLHDTLSAPGTFNGDKIVGMLAVFQKNVIMIGTLVVFSNGLFVQKMCNCSGKPSQQGLQTMHFQNCLILCSLRLHLTSK